MFYLPQTEGGNTARVYCTNCRHDNNASVGLRYGLRASRDLVKFTIKNYLISKCRIESVNMLIGVVNHCGLTLSVTQGPTKP